MSFCSPVNNWAARTPEGFIFSVKVPQIITHEKALTDCDAELAESLKTTDILGPKLGPMIFQFPGFDPNTRVLMFMETTSYRMDLELINDNFDTGGMTGPGKYRMNDEAHAKLLGMLAEQKFVGASPGVREELLHFFSEPDAPYATKRNVKAWAKAQVQLEQLKAAPPSEVLPSFQPAEAPLPR